MPEIPTDPSIDNLQMYLGTIVALLREELGRESADFENPEDNVAAVMLSMALYGATGEDLQRWLAAQPEALAYRAIQQKGRIHGFD